MSLANIIGRRSYEKGVQRAQSLSFDPVRNTTSSRDAESVPSSLSFDAVPNTMTRSAANSNPSSSARLGTFGTLPPLTNMSFCSAIDRLGPNYLDTPASPGVVSPITLAQIREVEKGKQTRKTRKKKPSFAEWEMVEYGQGTEGEEVPMGAQ